MKIEKYKISLKSHSYNLAILALTMLLVSYFVRFVFVLWSYQDLNSFSKLSLALLIGGVFDFSMIIYALVPFVLLPFFIRKSGDSEKAVEKYKRSFLIMLAFVLFIGIFLSVGELVFWNEFHSRFNFIAVDYLLYTHEVVRNIWESYPVIPILLAVLFFSLGISWWFLKVLKTELTFKTRRSELIKYVGIFTLLITANTFFAPTNLLSRLNDFKLGEISKNGIYSLFEAYFANQMEYENFYLSTQRKDAFAEVRKHLQGEKNSFEMSGDTIQRNIISNNQIKRYNVILVAMESFSASFLKSYGNTQGLTPNLDALEKESLNFNNIYATGTRTVRGLEALMLSVPPTPGQSIVRRPHNENLYSLADYFEDNNYAAEFLYGGYSYFDNMNRFFSKNGMKVWDHSSLKDSEITFSNAWGVCDGDVYRLSMRRADELYKEKKNFFQLIMTTSNHRPYTYPQKIDIPSGSGREGAVKYSDYAIGEFIAEAKKKPWFKDTIFVFVADHDASVSGKTELPISDYRIPFMIYAPHVIKPQTISKLASQIDVAPTLLGLLNYSYQSHFYGYDLLKPDYEERTFISNYQTVAYLKNSTLTLLSPNKKVQQFEVDTQNNIVPSTSIHKDLLDETVAYYQTAYVLFKEGLMQDSGSDRILNSKQYDSSR